ncbi:MAG TPA: DoxX family protein [Candidatus Binatia bacterium]|jgi:putative oxidoreductase|nr:DoxX family protein [Candidatus Binatia bacterium]
MQLFSSLHAYGDLGLLALRVGVGSIFLAHGLAKKASWKMQPSEQMPAKMIKLMRLLSVCEPLGAVGVLTGSLTQLAAACLAVIMVGAINMKMKVWKKKFYDQEKHDGWELDFMILCGCAALFVMGAGAWSVDRLLFRI